MLEHWNSYPYIHNQGRAYKQNIVGLGTGPGPTKRMAERYTNSRPESSNLMNVSNGSESNRDQHGYYGEHDEWGRRYQDRQHDDYQQEHQYDQPLQEQQHDGYQYSQQYGAQHQLQGIQPRNQLNSNLSEATSVDSATLQRVAEQMDVILIRTNSMQTRSESAIQTFNNKAAELFQIVEVNRRASEQGTLQLSNKIAREMNVRDQALQESLNSRMSELTIHIKRDIQDEINRKHEENRHQLQLSLNTLNDLVADRGAQALGTAIDRVADIPSRNQVNEMITQGIRAALPRPGEPFSVGRYPGRGRGGYQGGGNGMTGRGGGRGAGNRWNPMLRPQIIYPVPMQINQTNGPTMGHFYIDRNYVDPNRFDENDFYNIEPWMRDRLRFFIDIQQRTVTCGKLVS